MKAHIPSVQPTALLWNYPETEAAYPALAAACAAVGLRLKPVGSSQAGATVGALCGLPGAGEAALLLHLEPDAYPPALILSGLPEKALDRLLVQLKTGGVTIPLKAVVTPTNQKWPFCELLAELVRERQALEKPGTET